MKTAHLLYRLPVYALPLLEGDHITFSAHVAANDGEGNVTIQVSAKGGPAGQALREQLPVGSGIDISVLHVDGPIPHIQMHAELVQDDVDGEWLAQFHRGAQVGAELTGYALPIPEAQILEEAPEAPSVTVDTVDPATAA